MVTDGRGGREPDFTGATSVDLDGWALDAGNTLADQQNRDGALIQWTARGPFDADIDRHDRITVSGEQFKIDGAVIRQPGPTAATSHTILLLAKWKG
ncbi:hypothetical protein [Microbacterium sp. NIBRBAC000506063]|uniref:hypothetical protein n=1 Tax=Microbacterium sp. NIBRBAC000506063 TaxID=2734618 RepID=UPI001BB71B51|nr:hypothetical protein [Microbacterium sp. NIBRBAC000506063]QTV79483.1 hypothetical protein KAE78_11305 [Microbacterium sp. NIBRBAC000506063]